MQAVARPQTYLRVRDLRTGGERWLFGPVERDQQEACFSRDLMPGSAFTPDSRALITTAGGKIVRISMEDGGVTPIPFTAQVTADIGPALDFHFEIPDNDRVLARQIRDARLSPDGKQIVFTAFNRVWVMAYPGAKPQRLTGFDVGEHHPAWTPDGRSVIFATWNEESGGHVYRKDLESNSGPVQLTRTPAFYSRPQPHPSGNGIFTLRAPASQRIEDQMLRATGVQSSRAFHMTTRGLATQLHKIPNGGGETRYVAEVNTTNPLQFAADPDRIYYYNRHEGLASLKLDGGDRRAHLRVEEMAYAWPRALCPAAVSDLRISPDGTRLLASSEDQNLYILDLPETGADAAIADSISIKSGKRITAIGGDFMSWAPDGRSVTASLGATLFRYRVPRDSDEYVVEKHREPASYLLEEMPVEVAEQKNQSSETLAITGARLITMEGEEVIESGTLVVKGERIAAVGGDDEVKIPADALVMDASGMTIIAGLRDLHGHVYDVADPPATQPWTMWAHLSYGVTTNMDAFGNLSTTYYADMVAADLASGPRMFSTGPGLVGSYTKDGYEDAVAFARRNKIYYGHNRLKQYEVGDRRERQWTLMAAREFTIRPTTETSGDMKLSLTQLIDGYPAQEHNLTTPYYDDVAQLIARTGMINTTTLLVLRGEGGPSARDYFFQYTDVIDDRKLRAVTPDPARESFLRRRSFWFHADEHVFSTAAADAARVVAAGGSVAVGAHGELYGLGIHWELWALAKGLSKHDTLRAGTIWGAESLGYSDDLGSLKSGKMADLVLLNDNPLQDIRNTNSIRFVMKNGVLYDADTLATVWPNETPANGPYWHDFRYR